MCIAAGGDAGAEPTTADGFLLHECYRRVREQILAFMSDREVPTTNNVSEQNKQAHFDVLMQAAHDFVSSGSDRRKPYSMGATTVTKAKRVCNCDHNLPQEATDDGNPNFVKNA